jgi:hypothetical protein
MSKITLTNLVNLQNETTAVNAINTNNTTLTTAMDNTLSRNGAIPNTMSSNIDMNGNQILNLPTPVAGTSPARLQDVVSNPTLVLTIPPVGTSGGVVGLLNTANTYSGNNTHSGNNVHSGTNSFSNTSSFTGQATMVAPILGTPASVNLSNATALPVSSITGTAAGMSTFLATPTSANLLSTMTTKTGTGNNVFATSPTLVTPVLGAATGTSLAVTGALTSSSPALGIGYTTGAGGIITQATNKSTAVTLNASSGAITMNNASLAAATIVTFQLNNTSISAGDVLILNHISGGTIGAYTLNAQCQAAAAQINIRNNTAGALAEAIVIQFAIIHAVNV